MKRRAFPHLFLFPILLAGGLISSSCTTMEPPRREVAYEEYEEIPIIPTSGVYRFFLKATPIVGRDAFYGHYGGFGNRGGEPIDSLDNLFRKHDIVYYEANQYRDLVAADEALLVAMRKLDPSGLSRRGQKYRHRAIRYFESPGTLFVTKPITSPVPRPDRANAFESPEEIRRFLTDPEIQFP
jgi:hypothetical protein